MVPVPVTGVSLNKDNTTITVGDTELLTAEVLPEDATNKSVTWQSGGNQVFTTPATGSATSSVNA